jgi:hypothetical protein
VFGYFGFLHEADPQPLQPTRTSDPRG